MLYRLLSLVFILCFLFAVVHEARAADDNGRWTREQAWTWYKAHPWIVGFNFVPSTSCNSTEIWQKESFDAKTIDHELALGASLGFDSCRVFVQYLVWKNDPNGLKQRIGQFLEIANKHGLTTTLVLFDDCAFGDPPQSEPYLGKQHDPVPGMQNSCWTPSPGYAEIANQSDWPSLESYIKDIVGAFGHDKRVLMWDLYNEPHDNSRIPILHATFSWARAMHPTQPLTAGVWGAPAEVSQLQLDLSDVITFHCYSNYAGVRSAIGNFKNQFRPVINTEWMARPLGGVWSTDLPLFKCEGVGCYNWGLVNGRTQCQYAWDSPRGASEPQLWFHDLLHRNGEPYDPSEVKAIRAVTTDKIIDWDLNDYTMQLSSPTVPAHSLDGIQFSDGWTRWNGAGPFNSHLDYANAAGAEAEWTGSGSSVTLVHKVGPDCGIADIFIDGAPATQPQLDTYAAVVDYNCKSVIADHLSAGSHAITVKVSGNRNPQSSNTYFQIVSFQSF
jgi:hypothetical protein